MRALFLLLTISCASACSPSHVIWEGEDIHVELTSDPDIKKIVHGERTLFYKVQEGYAYLDDHTLLGPVDEDGVLLEYLKPMASTRSDCIFWIFCGEFRWPKGVVPYTIHKDVSPWQRAQVDMAIRSIQAKTKILMVPKEDSHKNFVEFHPGKIAGSCSSFLGMNGGRQVIQLARNGCSAPTVEHEIGHALGLLHEHQRCDRNEHVQIHWRNMNPIYFFNFINLCFMGKDHGEYDARSNMHYHSHAFSRNGEPTITLRSGGWPSPSPYFTAGDLKAIDDLYAREYEKR